MKRFVFRAQAALDLRTRELEQAQRELAHAEALRTAARQRVSEADATAARARGEAGSAQRAAGDITQFEWYRFWILRLDHERAAHAAALARCDDAVMRAAAACVRAQQRRDSLQRFRDKARKAFDAAEHAAETKLIDELATRRYVARHS